MPFVISGGGGGGGGGGASGGATITQTSSNQSFQQNVWAKPSLPAAQLQESTGIAVVNHSFVVENAGLYLFLTAARVGNGEALRADVQARVFINNAAWDFSRVTGVPPGATHFPVDWFHVLSLQDGDAVDMRYIQREVALVSATVVYHLQRVR